MQMPETHSHKRQRKWHAFNTSLETRLFDVSKPKEEKKKKKRDNPYKTKALKTLKKKTNKKKKTHTHYRTSESVRRAFSSSSHSSDILIPRDSIIMSFYTQHSAALIQIIPNCFYINKIPFSTHTYPSSGPDYRPLDSTHCEAMHFVLMNSQRPSFAHNMCLWCCTYIIEFLNNVLVLYKVQLRCFWWNHLNISV